MLFCNFIFLCKCLTYSFIFYLTPTRWCGDEDEPPLVAQGPMGNIHKVSYNSVSSNGRIVLPRTPLPKLKASEMVSYKKWHVNQNLKVHRASGTWVGRHGEKGHRMDKDIEMSRFPLCSRNYKLFSVPGA